MDDISKFNSNVAQSYSFRASDDDKSLFRSNLHAMRQERKERTLNTSLGNAIHYDDIVEFFMYCLVQKSHLYAHTFTW
jgi:hypothetical protein